MSEGEGRRGEARARLFAGLRASFVCSVWCVALGFGSQAVFNACCFQCCLCLCVGLQRRCVRVDRSSDGGACED